MRVSIDWATHRLIFLEDGSLMNFLKLMQFRCGDSLILTQTLHLFWWVWQVGINLGFSKCSARRLTTRHISLLVLLWWTLTRVSRWACSISLTTQSIFLGLRMLSLSLKFETDMATSRFLHFINLLVYRSAIVSMQGTLPCEVGAATRIVISERRLWSLKIATIWASAHQFAFLLATRRSCSHGVSRALGLITALTPTWGCRMSLFESWLSCDVRGSFLSKYLRLLITWLQLSLSDTLATWS